MKSIPISNKIENRKDAIEGMEVFKGRGRSGVFDKSLGIDKHISIQNLHSLISEYSTKLVVDKYRDPIFREGYVKAHRAEDYMVDLISKRDNFVLKNEQLKTLYNVYKNLLKEIGDYNFIPHSRGSYGDNQNKTNREILLYFTAFEDKIMEIFKVLDNCKELPEQKLEQLILELETHIVLLEVEREKYHKSWEYINRPAYPKYACADSVTTKEMYNNKKEWRLVRNDACYKLLKTIRGLFNLASKYSSNFENDFNEYIEYLKAQPYYFCFIDIAEKQKLERAKILRKEQSRQV